MGKFASAVCWLDGGRKIFVSTDSLSVSYVHNVEVGSCDRLGSVPRLDRHVKPVVGAVRNPTNGEEEVVLCAGLRTASTDGLDTDIYNVSRRLWRTGKRRIHSFILYSLHMHPYLKLYLHQK